MKSSMKYLVIPLVAISALMTGCDKSKSAIEQVKSITEDKYPVANMPDEPLDKPLEILKNSSRLALTINSTIGVKDDGSLWVWGNNIGLKGLTNSSIPQRVNDIDNVLSVSASENHTLILKKDGTVWGWGSNFHGKLEPNDKRENIDNIIQVRDLKNVSYIYADWDSSYFTLENGDVYILGNNENTIAESEKISKLSKPTKIKNVNNILMMKGSLALNKDGELFQYIYNNGTNSKMEKLNFPKKVVDFVFSSTKLVLLEDGTIWSWGHGIDGGQGNSKKIIMPTRIKGLSKVVKISSNLAYTNDGSLYNWGDYAYECKTCLPNNVGLIHFKQPVLFGKNLSITQLVSKDNVSTLGFVDTTGNVHFFGSNLDSQYGNGKASNNPHQNYPAKDTLFNIEKSLFNIHQ